MSQHSNHKVKMHTWVGGLLNTIEEYFEKVEDAVEFVKRTPHNNAKIHNTDGEVVYNSNGMAAEESTYA